MGQRITIGIDESGTGAWAGPYTVCAVATNRAGDSELAGLGVRDSKKLSDDKRRLLVQSIADISLGVQCVPVSVDHINKFGKNAWRKAILTCVELLMKQLGDLPSSIVIDGSNDRVVDMLHDAGHEIVRCEIEADGSYTSVGAASIVAKTIRNDLMHELHQEFPAYRWSNNAGYGTVEHQKAIDVHGVTVHHRRIKPLIKYFT